MGQSHLLCSVRIQEKQQFNNKFYSKLDGGLVFCHNNTSR